MLSLCPGDKIHLTTVWRGIEYPPAKFSEIIVYPSPYLVALVEGLEPSLPVWLKLEVLIKSSV